MTYAVVYAEAAVRDIEDLGDYLISERGEEFAKAYLGRLRIRIGTLQRNAHRFRERKELGPGCRALLVPPYLVFYRLAGTTVYVQRVLHGSRNITPESLGS